MQKGNETSQDIIKNLVEGISSNENFKKEVSQHVAQILMKQKNAFDAGNLSNFFSNKNSFRGIVSNALGKSDLGGESDKKSREKKLREKKTYSAFFSRVPPRTLVPLKRGDSVTDIVSKLYTLVDKSFERKKKEEKEQKKLEKTRQKKREELNKKLLKSLATSGGNLKEEKEESSFPWWLLLGGLAALKIPDFLDALKGIDPNNILRDIDNKFDNFFNNIGKAGLVFGAAEGSRRFTQKSKAQKNKEKIKKLKERAEELKKQSKAKGTTAPKVETKPVGEKPKAETPTGEKKAPQKVPQRKAGESKTQKNKGLQSKKVPTTAPPTPEPTATPAPTPVAEKTATKTSKTIENIKTVRDNARKAGNILNKGGKAGLFLGKILPVAFLASDLTKALDDYEENKDEKQLKKAASGIIGGFIGATVGARLASAAVGAGVGTIVPGVGNIVGAITGFAVGTLGGGAGAMAGQEIGEAIYNGLDSADINIIDLDKYKETLSGISSAVSKIDKSIGFTDTMDKIGGYLGKAGGDLGAAMYEQSRDYVFSKFNQDTSQLNHSGTERFQEDVKPIATAATQLGENFDYTKKDLSRRWDEAKQTLSNLFEVTTRNATIMADYVNTGDALTSLQRTNEMVQNDVPFQPVIINQQSQAAVKGPGKTRSQGEISTEHKFMKKYKDEHKLSMKQ